uniref:RNase NYN domain-containing protein n=1 Tax=Anopheles culicifacies TaxID=139723 RepID=A0A182LZI4_9DIPT
MFSGSLCPGRYLTFSCVVLMISVSFLPSIISSYTYIVTRSSNVDNRLALTPTILAMADPLECKANAQKKELVSGTDDANTNLIRHDVAGIYYTALGKTHSRVESAGEEWTTSRKLRAGGSMARNKTAKRNSETAQLRRSLTKMKTSTFKRKGVQTKSHKSAAQYNKTGGKAGKVQKKTGNNSLRILEQTNTNTKQIRQTRVTRQLSSTMNNSLNVNNNRQSPNGCTGENIKHNNNWKPTADTILIEDSDEESASAGNSESTKPLFYLDRNPGIRDAEVPLYNVCHEVENVETKDTNHPPPDDSVIVLDNTIDKTMNDSLKEMQINVEPIQPSASDTASTSSAKIIGNVPVARHSDQSAATVTNESSDVIELSDNSDTETGILPASKNTTPAFPAMDCIPLGHLNGKMFSVKGLQLCINYFKKLGYEVTAVVPQFRLKKHHSTDYVLLDKMHREGDITLAPCKNLPGQYSSSYDDRRKRTPGDSGHDN